MKVVSKTGTAFCSMKQLVKSLLWLVIASYLQLPSQLSPDPVWVKGPVMDFKDTVLGCGDIGMKLGHV